ncbi:hypothetical protein GOV06_02160 [Candidatus Woesearchaeota archaeon]|nr:hypothetical protein [Candidatus Woesearchaeota archaeon]
MKQVGLCQSCGRTVYTNDIDLCKRCHNEVGLEFLKEMDVEEAVEEGPSMEELGLESSEESKVLESDSEEEAEEEKE